MISAAGCRVRIISLMRSSSSGFTSCLVQKNDITEFNLPDDKIFNVFLVNPFPGKVVAAGEFALQAQGVHYGSDAVQAADAILGVHAAQAGNGADGLRDGFRFADAAGFDDDIIETLHPHDFAYLLYQVRFQRTTDATVLKRNEAFVFLAHNAAFLDEVCIDVYLAYVIDDNRVYWREYGLPRSFCHCPDNR